LTRGARHWLRDSLQTRAAEFEKVLVDSPIDAYGRMSHGGGGRRTVLLCGGFGLEGGGAEGMVGVLPPVIHVRSESSRPVPWLAGTIELLMGEIESDAPGASEVIARLADALLTQTLRWALAQLESEDRTRLAALRDRQIARAVELLHRYPDRAWTVGELAAEVALSRSAFTSRFRQAVGESPNQYARRTRLALAARLLHSSDAPLAEIAKRTGWESEYSFSKAFRRAFGISPGAYRARGGPTYT
jgi:AraC-like DNA-binding protein